MLYLILQNACLSLRSDNKDSTDLPSHSLTKGQVQREGIHIPDKNSYRILPCLLPPCTDATAADNKVSIQEVIAKAGISMDVLEQECSSGMLPNLANFCVDWKLVGFHLKLTRAEIAAIDGDNRTVDEKRIGVLVKWREKFAFKATYRVLIQGLLDCERMSDAVDVCKAVSPS